jgi:hypothetical protein
MFEAKYVGELLYTLIHVMISSIPWFPLSTTSFPYKCDERQEDCIEGVLFVQQLRTEEQTGNSASVQNVCLCKNHSIKTIQIKCGNCREQS